MTAAAIPIRNLWYLLCYAWDCLAARDRASAEALAAERPGDLLARVLIEGTRRAIRRGLERRYHPLQEEGRRARGKIDVSASLKRLLLRHGRAACTYDDLTHDTPYNRTVKATLRRIVADEALPARLRADARELVCALHEVSDRVLGLEAFRGLRFHRNIVSYRLLLSVCELLHRNWLPRPGGAGRGTFLDFRGDDREMGLVWEAFVRGFLRREQGAFRVTSPRVAWDARAAAGQPDLLPTMQTDIALESAHHSAVIETKLTKRVLDEHFGKRSLRSEHLYQLFAYLKNAESRGGRWRTATGVLLYPTAGAPVDCRFEMQGHTVLVRSINLAATWSAVRDALLALVDVIAADCIPGDPASR